MRFYKTKMCSFHLNGSCARGHFCTYAHSLEGLKIDMLTGHDTSEPGSYSPTDSFSEGTSWSTPTPLMSPELGPCPRENSLITVEDPMHTVAYLKRSSR